MSATRRIVTGHASDGRSVVLADGPIPHVRSRRGARFDEVWSVDCSPPVLGLAPTGEPTSSAPNIAVGSGAGNIVRVIEFAPAKAGGTRSPMHRTRTVDYGVVLEGEIVLLLSDSEIALKAGDVVIQRGTDHAWENRADKPAKMAFVLIDAEFDPELSQLLDGGEITP